MHHIDRNRTNNDPANPAGLLQSKRTPTYCSRCRRPRSTFTGAPYGYLLRVMALFLEFVEPKFSGHVLHPPPAAPGTTSDDEVQDAELPVSVYELPNIVLKLPPAVDSRRPSVPPLRDAEKHGTVMVNRGRGVPHARAR